MFQGVSRRESLGKDVDEWNFWALDSSAEVRQDCEFDVFRLGGWLMKASLSDFGCEC